MDTVDWKDRLTEDEREAEKRHFESFKGRICNQCGEGWPCVTKGTYGSLTRARLEVAAKESELSVVQRDLNGANAYIEEVRNQRDRVEAEVAAYKAARDCTINNGWLQEGLECSVDGDPACGLHLKMQLDASRALVAEQRRAMGVIEPRFVPRGGCDSPGHASPDICWWLDTLALTEADMLERMEVK